MSQSKIQVASKVLASGSPLELSPEPALIQSTHTPSPPSEPAVQKVESTNSSRSPPAWDVAISEPVSAPPTPVRETRKISIEYNPKSGRKQLNSYEIYRELGRGQHGKVKLGRDLSTGEFFAIKTVDRKDRPRLGRPRKSSAEEKIRREIAILKKCQHPNIVRLYEVLDDISCRKIYLVLEYLEKGEIKWQNADGTPAMSREAAKQAARDTLLGLEYIHSMNIIHRDIKPANLLLSKDNVVKISDFGVSYAFTNAEEDNELEMAKTVGTPAFFAPELCMFEETPEGTKRTPITSKIDIWAYGVTLFALIYGHLPFDADNEYELFRIIAHKDVELPDPGADADLSLANDLLKHLLDRNPETRWDITRIKQHPWLASGLAKVQMEEFLSRDMAERHRVDVSTQEVNEAVRGIASKLKLGLSRIAYQFRSRSSSGAASLRSDPSSAESSSRNLAGSIKQSSRLASRDLVSESSVNGLRDLRGLSGSRTPDSSDASTGFNSTTRSGSEESKLSVPTDFDSNSNHGLSRTSSLDAREQGLGRSYHRPVIAGTASGHVYHQGSGSESSLASADVSRSKASMRLQGAPNGHDLLSLKETQGSAARADSQLTSSIASDKSRKVRSASTPAKPAWSPQASPPSTRPKTFYALEPIDVTSKSPISSRQVDLLGHSESSSDDDDDDDDDSGELTLVLGRSASRIL